LVRRSNFRQIGIIKNQTTNISDHGKHETHNTPPDIIATKPKHADAGKTPDKTKKLHELLFVSPAVADR
jgi:hypothetical protein